MSPQSIGRSLKSCLLLELIQTYSLGNGASGDTMFTETVMGLRELAEIVGVPVKRLAPFRVSAFGNNVYRAADSRLTHRQYT